MKKRMQTMLLLLLTTVLALHSSCALAGVAYPGKVPFTEPATGETVQVFNHGDEYFSYMTDTDGNLLVLDGVGFLRYVTEDANVFATGGYVTRARARSVDANVNINGGVEQLQTKLQALQSSLTAGLPSSYSSESGSKDVPNAISLTYNFVGDRAEGHAQVCTTDEDKYLDDPSNYPPMEDTCPLLVLKLQFKDIKCLFSDEQWHDRIFENGITQYYQTVSDGQFTYRPVEETSGEPNDGVVTVTLPINCPRYTLVNPKNNQLVQNDPVSGMYSDDEGKKYAIYNMGSLFAYAMLAAEDSVDFDKYDRNKDGFLSPTELAVLVVYSGLEASYGGAYAAQGKPAVWAHSWKYNNITSDRPDEECHYMTMRVDNVRVSKYTVIGELANYPNEYDYDLHSGTPRQAQYGTASHELGHDMGLPDLYPTDSAYHMQQVEGLSLMAGGSWGAIPGAEAGSSPTHLDPVSKIYLGFYDSVTLDETGKFTLYATEPSAQYNILRVNTDNPNVYYLVENRQFTGYDRGLSTLYNTNAGGLVIWRVDRKELNARWSPNTVNNEVGHYGLMPVFVKEKTDPYDLDDENEPFWSAVAKRSSIVLGSSPQITFSTLSLPSGSMTLSVDRQTVIDAPLTGDRSQPALWIAVGLAALACAAAICFVGRQKRAHRPK